MRHQGIKSIASQSQVSPENLRSSSPESEVLASDDDALPPLFPAVSAPQLASQNHQSTHVETTTLLTQSPNHDELPQAPIFNKTWQNVKLGNVEKTLYQAVQMSDPMKGPVTQGILWDNDIWSSRSASHRSAPTDNAGFTAVPLSERPESFQPLADTLNTPLAMPRLRSNVVNAHKLKSFRSQSYSFGQIDESRALNDRKFDLIYSQTSNPRRPAPRLEPADLDSETQELQNCVSLDSTARRFRLKEAGDRRECYSDRLDLNHDGSQELNLGNLETPPDLHVLKLKVQRTNSSGLQQVSRRNSEVVSSHRSWKSTCPTQGSEMLATMSSRVHLDPEFAPSRRAQIRDSQSRRHSLALMPLHSPAQETDSGRYSQQIWAPNASQNLVSERLVGLVGHSLRISSPEQQSCCLSDDGPEDSIPKHGSIHATYESDVEHQAPGEEHQRFKCLPIKPKQLSPLLETSSHRQMETFSVVTFKCFRAGIYVLPQNHHECIERGDLILVDADRGADLGTLASDPLLLEEARNMVVQYNQRHHDWLLAFACGDPKNEDHDNLTFRSKCALNHTSLKLNGDLLRDTMPRMIRRKVHSSELGILREKEGAEAKAKRICQQKVHERQLNMEILDAEFQIDWKKLTFYYIAHEYVNFNGLVTDLFKLYKTRIWMSAINCAALEQFPQNIVNQRDAEFSHRSRTKGVCATSSSHSRPGRA